MEIGKIVIKKKIEAKDYRFAIYFNVIFRNRIMPIAMAAAGVLSIMEIVYCALTGFAKNLNYTLLSAVLILGFIGFILYKTEKTAKKAAKKAEEMIGQERSVIFSEKNVTAEGTEKGDYTSMEWDSLSKAYELKQYFIVFFADPKTIVVPKEYMDYDQMRELTKLLQKKAGKNFINRSK